MAADQFQNASRETLLIKLREASAEIAVLLHSIDEANANLRMARADYAAAKREMGWHDRRELGLAERIVDLETRCVRCAKVLKEGG